ncbi:MAG: hypothetical protein ABSH19_05020 [Opitutales bacterium]|jgi:recombinational DNA repair protein (RecF pathway)
MSRLLEAEGLVLDRTPAGENHLRLTLLTPAPGLLKAMLRDSPAKSARSPASTRPDLFDHAAVVLEAPAPGAAHGAVYFVREYKVLRRHAGLGRRYPALTAASSLASLVARHAMHFETCAPVFSLCRQAFGALEDGAPPDAVHLKALFLLATTEGYAAREQWLALLAPEDRELVLTILRKPAADAARLPPADAARLPRLRQACERWLAEHTDLSSDEPRSKLRK